MKKILIITLALALNFTGTQHAPCMKYFTRTFNAIKNAFGFNKPETKLTDLPDEMIAHILSYSPEDFINYAHTCKKFRDIIFEEKLGKLVIKIEFLRALLGTDQTIAQDVAMMSPQEKAKRLWTFVARTGYRPALHHYQTIVGQPISYQELPDHTLELLEECPIHIATRYGKKHVVRNLLDEGANGYRRGPNHLTPIHIAIKYGHVQLFKFLKTKLNIPGNPNWWHFVHDTTIQTGQPNLLYNIVHLATLSNNKEMLTQIHQELGEPTFETGLSQQNFNQKT